jgi:hypothetical protein
VLASLANSDDVRHVPLAGRVADFV